jgi:hypothetical protein
MDGEDGWRRWMEKMDGEDGWRRLMKHLIYEMKTRKNYKKAKAYANRISEKFGCIKQESIFETKYQGRIHL